jgi:hypothetical protein
MNEAPAVGKADLIKWWDALDAWCEWRFEDAMALAAGCQHPDAQWLCALLADDLSLASSGRVRELTSSKGEDARALFLSGCAKIEETVRSAQLGYAPAQARMCFRGVVSLDQEFAWVQSSASKSDRNGIFALASCYATGRGCEKQLDKAASLMREAIALGHLSAPARYGIDFFAEDDWRRYHWWGSARERALEGTVVQLQHAARKQLRLFERGQGSGRIVYEIGAALCTTVAGACVPPHAERCVHLYRQWTLLAKDAIECWIVVGRRLGVAKDVRRLIAEKAWKERAAWSSVLL